MLFRWCTYLLVFNLSASLYSTTQLSPVTLIGKRRRSLRMKTHKDFLVRSCVVNTFCKRRPTTIATDFCIRKWNSLCAFCGFTFMKIKYLMNLILTAYNPDLCLTFITHIYHFSMILFDFFFFFINNFLIYEKLFPCYKD